MCLGAGALAGATIAGSCGRSDTPGQVVMNTSRKVQAASLGEKAPAPKIARTTAVYTEAVASLKPAVADGLVGESSGASLISARADGGLADFQAEGAAAAERESQNVAGRVRLGYDAWLSHQARAAALEQFDPSKQLADIDAQIKQKVEDGAKARAAKQKLDSDLAALEAKAKEQLDKSRLERDAETKLRQQAVNANATVRADLITKANQHRRASDGFDKEASLLRAQGAAKAPESRDVQAEIDRLTAQSKLLADAKAQLAARAKANTDDATAAKAEAMGAAQVIKDAVAELAKVRATVPELTDKAARTYGQAVGAAKAAGQKPETDQETKASAKLASATSKHGLADLLAGRARGLRDHAELLRSLAEANPPLPDSASYRTQADEASKQHEQALDAAKKGYEDAAAEYAGVPGKQDIKDRLAKIAEALKALGEGKVEVPAWLAMSRPAGAAGSSAAAAAPAASGAEAEVRKALEAMIAAGKDGDIERMLGMIHAKSPGDEKLLVSLGKVGAGFARLNTACKEKFGSPFADLMKQSGNPMMSGMADQMGGLGAGMGLGDLQRASADDLEIAMTDASTAKLTPKGGGESLNMVKVGGVWKLELELPPEAKMQLGPMMALIEPIGKLMDEIAGEVKAGKYATGNEMMAAVNQKLMPVLMQGMGGPGGPGGVRPPRKPPGGGGGGG